jgi:S-DNA-T family DNA segregation ATPase FtsK/SpoIIIE
VHLLLASQRLEEGRLRGLDTHLSYRIGLRTFSPMESRAVLGVPDAFELPRSPGHGYLRSGTEPIVRFKAAYASGAHGRGATPASAPSYLGQAIRARPYVPEYIEPPPVAAAPQPAPPSESDLSGDSLLDLLVGRMQGKGRPAHQVWLAPLDQPASLGDVLGPIRVNDLRGLIGGRPELIGTLQPPVALVDKPFEQRRDLLLLQLHGSAGHVVVVGGPQSG